ncbi:unnamed protein product [Rangifer tarandus platyrhynchus]|uniref:Uncharacterized protein n=1 Tax=Rangifer tarandus platyrhynchus TaxID=3082113 RepID=A0AC59ZNG3_RANTA
MWENLAATKDGLAHQPHPEKSASSQLERPQGEHRATPEHAALMWKLKRRREEASPASDNTELFLPQCPRQLGWRLATPHTGDRASNDGNFRNTRQNWYCFAVLPFFPWGSQFSRDMESTRVRTDSDLQTPSVSCQPSLTLKTL